MTHLRAPGGATLAFALAALALTTLVAFVANDTPPVPPTTTPPVAASPTVGPSAAPTSPPPTATGGPSGTPPARTPSSPSQSARPTPRPTAPPGYAPYCALDDVLTPIRDYARHARTWLDRTHLVPLQYVPPDLVPAAKAGFMGDEGEELVRSIVVTDLGAMRQAAGRLGHHLDLFSAYRSYAEQERTFNYWVSVGGYEQALRTSARAGHSEHQLGTTIDIGSGRTPPWEHADWAVTPAGAWVAEHAWEYGFVMSYPRGKEPVTCYSYEPWHYRWVGREVAAQVRASGLALREFQAR